MRARQTSKEEQEQRRENFISSLEEERERERSRSSRLEDSRFLQAELQALLVHAFVCVCEQTELNSKLVFSTHTWNSASLTPFTHCLIIGQSQSPHRSQKLQFVANTIYGRKYTQEEENERKL